jgi:hypothetical protein
VIATRECEALSILALTLMSTFSPLIVLLCLASSVVINVILSSLIGFVVLYLTIFRIMVMVSVPGILWEHNTISQYVVNHTTMSPHEYIVRYGDSDSLLMKRHIVDTFGRGS